MLKNSQLAGFLSHAGIPPCILESEAGGLRRWGLPVGACTPSLFTKTFTAIQNMPGPEPGAGQGVDKACMVPAFVRGAPVPARRQSPQAITQKTHH